MIFEKILKHDKYVFSLCDTLNARYDRIQTHVPLYSNKRRLVGEIDILAYKNGICDIYEVKCSHRISKAKRQLKKLRKLMSIRHRIVGKTFFFCGESGTLISV